MMFRRVAITLAGVTAAAFMAAGPAAAAAKCDDHEEFAGRHSSSGAVSYDNLGGPYGITVAHGGYKESTSYFGEGDG